MALMDEQIKKNVVDELYWDNRVDASNISVVVDDGKVTLKGEVPTYLASTAALDDTLKILGVLSVDNQLEVKFPVTTTIPADLEILNEIEKKLARNPDIDILDMEIQVVSGKVTLRGTVDAYWKKLYAEELVASEPGVLFINNHLAIVPVNDIIDQDIANDIVRSIESRAAVSADDVHVEVLNGHVRLSGSVPSWIAKRAAYEAALFTAGVVDVENNITINATRV